MKLGDFVKPENAYLLSEMGTETFEEGLRLGLVSMFISAHLGYKILLPIAEMLGTTVDVETLLKGLAEIDLDQAVADGLARLNEREV